MNIKYYKILHEAQSAVKEFLSELDITKEYNTSTGILYHQQGKWYIGLTKGIDAEETFRDMIFFFIGASKNTSKAMFKLYLNKSIVPKERKENTI